MIIKSLLFIIVLIFAYETIQKLYKLQEEYFTTTPNNIHNNIRNNINNKNINDNDTFVSLSTDPLDKDKNEKNDIAKTIAINCKAYPAQKNSIMMAKPILAEELDTPEYARFKPLEYDPTRLYYWRRDILIPEGIRRLKDDEKEIAKVQALYDKETNPQKKEILQDELDLFTWRNNILALQDSKTGLDRTMRDITTDYFPAEIGMSRPWREVHSHIPDYSNALNYGYQAYNKKQYYYE